MLDDLRTGLLKQLRIGVRGVECGAQVAVDVLQ